MTLVLQNNDLYYLGVFVVLFIIYGGNSIPVFASSVFEYLSGSTTYNIKVEDVNDSSLLSVIEKVKFMWMHNAHKHRLMVQRLKNS